MEHTRSTASKASSMRSSPEQASTAQLPPPASSVVESGKGPRRRNRAERAALQQEQELLEQQMAKHSFRYLPEIPLHQIRSSWSCWSFRFEPQSNLLPPWTAKPAVVNGYTTDNTTQLACQATCRTAKPAVMKSYANDKTT